MKTEDQINEELLNQKKQLRQTILDKRVVNPVAGSMNERSFDDRIAEFREAIATIEWVLKD